MAYFSFNKHRTGGTLCYTAEKACRITVASAVLHNICLANEIPLTAEDEHYRENRNVPLNEEEDPPPAISNRRHAVDIRQRLAATFA